MTKKPLDLTIFPPVPELPLKERLGLAEKIRAFGAHMAWHAERLREVSLTRAKRLNDTELAAEYWQADYTDTRHDREDEDLEPIPEIVHRFATLPHFDEDAP
ncbi:hypothetical protein OCL88_08175 [Paenarthrobacter sp. PAE-2]|uniref:hypothetical protein n=1 Tax=Paenarthrobacter sp. PAE-2 TaxID=2982532 RepID=UPI0022329850|nr:hypothetical protein [Paenarthrobacter sp. PAE-2]MCW3766448.1 hypothetical protein [Paenarthrobacter sp. PAE-2]